MRDSRPIAVQAARTGDSGQPPQAVAPRAKSRFDQPASTPPRVLRAPAKQRDDVYIPADLLPDRSDREHELTSTQIGVEHEAKRRRPNDRAPTSATNRRAAPEPDLVPPSLTERSTSGSSSSQVPEQSRTYTPAFDYCVLHTNFAFLRVSCLSLRMQASREHLCRLKVHVFAKRQGVLPPNWTLRHCRLLLFKHHLLQRMAV
jgi:hypothetical protein